MDLKIYQINMDRDEHNVAFLSLESTQKFQKAKDIPY